jgi:hypothetical protein
MKTFISGRRYQGRDDVAAMDNFSGFFFILLWLDLAMMKDCKPFCCG